MSNVNKLPVRAKHRLRILARFLRRAGYKFEGGKFYDKVIETIGRLDEAERKNLQGIVDWVEQYEKIETAIDTAPPRSRARKNNTWAGRNGASRPAPPGAKPEYGILESTDGKQNG